MAFHSARSVPLVILSSDKYSDVLIDLLVHLKKRVNLSMEIFYSLNSEEAAKIVSDVLSNTDSKNKYCHTSYKPLYSGQESWTETLKYAVTTLISRGYNKALFVLEDFFVTSVDYDLILKAAQTDNDIVYVSYRPRAISSINSFSDFGCMPNFNFQKILLRISPLYKYGISLQPAIWSLPKLLDYIDEAKPISPWNFERPYFGSVITNVVRIPRPAYLYQDQAIEKGRWFPLKALMYRRYSKRPLVSLGFYIQVLLRTGASKILDFIFNNIALFSISSPRE